VSLCFADVVLRLWSHAAGAREPRQVRKEAAVSDDHLGAVGLPELSHFCTVRWWPLSN